MKKIFILTLLSFLFLPIHSISAIETQKIKTEIFDGINQIRIENNLEPLKINKKLDKSAELKAKDMIVNSYFEHTSPEGKKIKDFLKEVKYKYILAGENLAHYWKYSNSKLANGVIGDWMESESHKWNILDESYDETGISILEYEGEVYIVQHFGQAYKFFTDFKLYIIFLLLIFILIIFFIPIKK